MVTEHQEKSIKHIDYCYSFYFSNIFRPFSVSIYFYFGSFGLSGYFMETNPSSNAGVKYLYKKCTLSFNIKKDMISLTEYSSSFNIPTSSNTCWVLVGCLLGACWVLVGYDFSRYSFPLSHYLNIVILLNSTTKYLYSFPNSGRTSRKMK